MKFKKAYKNLVYRLITMWRILFAKRYIVACDDTLRYNSNIYHAKCVSTTLQDVINDEITEMKLTADIKQILNQ